MVSGRRVRVLSPRHDRGQKVICLMRFALDGDSQINFARRFVRNPANENGDSHWDWPSPFEHRNERMNSMIFEALLAAITLVGYVAVQVRWAHGGGR